MGIRATSDTMGYTRINTYTTRSNYTLIFYFNFNKIFLGLNL